MKNLRLLPILFCLAIFCGCSRNKEVRYLEQLKSENPVLKKQAIVYLGQHTCTNAVLRFMELLNGDLSQDMKLSVLEALGNIGDRRASAHLLQCACSSNTEEQRVCITALARIKDPAAVKTLSDLTRNGDEGVRLSAIWALGVVGDQAAVPVLAELLSNPDKYVRYNAKQALKRLMK